MKKFISYQLLLFCLCTLTVFSQKLEYSSFLIPNELKENANAVIRDYTKEITLKALNEMVVNEKKIITILNKVGDRHLDLFANYDNDTKITKLSARIYDALGNELKKYSKGKFLDVSAVDGGTLYSDSRVKYVNYTPISYPYTLVFESEYKTTSTGFINGWFPLENYFVSVEKSTYKFNNPEAIPFRKKEINFENFDILKTEETNKLQYVLKNQKAFKYENEAISYRKILPQLKVAANKFYLKGVYGEASNWEDFGKWMYDKLLNGRDVLGEATKSKIIKLVEGIKDPIERAKIVYKFMQNTTRYISVQVGIGGWEPIAANQVDKVGYGDCKGLTNYTKALLDVASVESYYTVVYADEKIDIDKDFTSIQGNHIILNIPNKGNDVWLECTSQTMPFGFLGDFTEDRDVLVITPEKGIIKRTPAYKNDINLQTTNGLVQLDSEGHVKATLLRVSEGIQYDDKQGYETLSKEDLIKRYKSNDWSYNNNLELGLATLNNDKDKVVFTEDLEMSIKNYAAVNQGEYLFRVNVFNRMSYVPKRYRSRKLPLKISRGYKDLDELTIKIPEGYALEMLPETKELSTKFGNYKITFEKLDDSTLKYTKELLIKSGTYAKEDYKTYRIFRRSIARYENTRIALIKK
jgi:hypothetical protein